MSRLWLIDAGYLFNAQRRVREDGAYRFDYKLLRDQLEARGGPIWRAYYLNSTPNPPSDAQDAFHTWLRSAPPRGPQLITKLYALKSVRADRAYCEDCEATVGLSCPHDERHRIGNQQQKGVDVAIATLALVHSQRYETLLLSSGDGDLLEAIEYLSEQGKRIELAVFDSGVSTDLQARADQVFWIDEFANEVSSAGSVDTVQHGSAGLGAPRHRDDQAERGVGSNARARESNHGPIEFATGVIVNLIEDKGYGFVQPDLSGDNLFFHANDVEGCEFADLSSGEAVRFLEGVNPKDRRPVAKRVSPARLPAGTAHEDG